MRNRSKDALILLTLFPIIPLYIPMALIPAVYVWAEILVNHPFATFSISCSFFVIVRGGEGVLDRIKLKRSKWGVHEHPFWVGTFQKFQRYFVMEHQHTELCWKDGICYPILHLDTILSIIRVIIICIIWLKRNG